MQLARIPYTVSAGEVGICSRQLRGEQDFPTITFNKHESVEMPFRGSPCRNV